MPAATRHVVSHRTLSRIAKLITGTGEELRAKDPRLVPDRLAADLASATDGFTGADIAYL